MFTSDGCAKNWSRIQSVPSSSLRRSGSVINLSVDERATPSVPPPEVGLGAFDVGEDLRLQRLWIFELALVAHPMQELDANVLGSASIEGTEQKRFYGRLVLGA